MTKVLKPLAAAALIAAASTAFATPSTTFWTPATTYTQPAPVPHLTYDTYFGEQGALQIDTGVEFGLFSSKYLQAEAGFDLFYALFDVEVDREHGLQSWVTRFGEVGAFTGARILHLITIVLLAAVRRTEVTPYIQVMLDPVRGTAGILGHF